MKCAHQGCDCEGTLDRGGKKYCSDACASAGSTTAGCGCGHAGCKGRKTADVR
jgi:hypothetical protein